MCAGLASNEYALVVRCKDINHRALFPNSYVVSDLAEPFVNLVTDRQFSDLRYIGTGSFGLAVCTGLLEHVPEPGQFVAQLHRILRPGGRLILSASAVFPPHGNPDNYFHFTPNGLRYLFREWTGFERLEGSSRPFKTIAILLQRINFQCEIFPPLRPFIELAYHVVPVLDRLVLREYDRYRREDEVGPVETMMPAALHAVIIR
jgi:SAM-dependent methyltransferase